MPDSPSIIRPPTGLVGATMATVQFTVEAAGAEPLAYQWRKNGMNLVNGGHISGVTTTNLTIADLQGADAGDYSVVVSNASGTATSLPALLLVLPPPTDDLFPIALNNQWTYDNGGTARVSGVQDVGGRKLVAITNVGTTGYVNVTVDAVGVWNTSYSGPNYIVVYWGWASTYWLKYPMSLGQQWSDSLLGNGYRINHISTVTSTNATVTINGTPCGPCTEVTATVDYPNGYSPGEIWICFRWR